MASQATTERRAGKERAGGRAGTAVRACVYVGCRTWPPRSPLAARLVGLHPRATECVCRMGAALTPRSPLRCRPGEGRGHWVSRRPLAIV